MAAAAGRDAGIPRVQGGPAWPACPSARRGGRDGVGSSLLAQAEAGDTRQSDPTEVRLLAREWRANDAEMVRGLARSLNL
jgi:hypothetical protein